MFDKYFSQQLHNTVIFTDTLNKNFPYISPSPRNCDSIAFITNGTLLYEKGDEKEIIKEGQIAYISSGSIDKSSAYMCDSVSYIAANFHLNNAEPGTILPFKTLCSQNDIYGYKKMFQSALNYFLSKSPGYIAICNGIIMQIIGFLYNEREMKNIDFYKIRCVENAVDYLKNNYNRIDFQISELAQISNMSEKHFRNIFFEVYKKTPFVFLQEFRINKSEILLLNTSKTVSDIASQCGFSDIYSFSHCFKKHIGISPKKYRVINEYNHLTL